MILKALMDFRRTRYSLEFILIIFIMCLIPGQVTEVKAFLNPSQNSRLNMVNRGIVPSPVKVRYIKSNNSSLRDKKTGDDGAIIGFDYNDDDVRDLIGIWNSWGTIHRLYVNKKSGLPEPGRLKTSGSVENGVNDNINDKLAGLAKDFIRENPYLFKVQEEDLVFKNTNLRGDIVYCQFEQYYEGIRVYAGGVVFRFDKSGTLLLVSGDTYPDIDINPCPFFDANIAVDIARERLGLSDMPGRVGEVELFVLPLPSKAGMEYILAWQVCIFSDSQIRGPGSNALFIDAHSGEVVLICKLERHGINGRVGGLVLPEYYSDPPEWMPFSNLRVYLLNQSNPVNEYNMDHDPGWTREGMWEFGMPVPQDVDKYGHAGCPDPSEGVSGLNLFGYNLLGDYTNLMKPKYLITDTIYCQNKTGIALTFWRWLGVQKEYWESDNGDISNYDRATIEVSNDGGQTWTVIWSNGTSQIEDGIYDSFNRVWKGWNLQFFDISDLSDGKDVVIRWGIGPTDDSGTFCGWNIDDVGIYESLDVLTDTNGFFEFPNTDDVLQNKLLTQLSGRYVNVYNEDGASAINYSEAIKGDLQTALSVDWYTSHTPLKDFDEFNVFYHMNFLLNYIKQIDPLYDAMDKKGPINVFVRYGENYKNAYWSPENKICFGEGDCRADGYRNFTHFSDIIYHEYTHAITDSFYSYLMPPLTSIRKSTSGDQTGPVFVTEFDAIHEAFSDYWACTINGDPLIGDGDFWIKHKYVRALDNKFKYPDDYGDDAYANSLIVSGAMWETRELIGKEVADTLFHFARYGGATTFDDFLVDVLLQDEITFNGDHITLLKDIFGQRGISRAPSAPSGVVGNAGNSFIDIQWQPNRDEEEVKGYYVYFRTENDIASDREDPSVRRDAGLTKAYRLDGLTNNTTYVLKVTAYNFYDAESEPSDFVYATPYSESSNTSLGSERKIFCFIDTLYYKSK